MTKKVKQVKNIEKEEKLTINNISVGDVIPDSTRNPKEWQVNDDLISQMRRYEQESDKSAIWKNKITGMFLYFKWMEDHPEEKTKTKKKPGRKPKDVDIEELEEKEIVKEENLMLDCIADCKTEYGVKTVNTKSQKFKRFYYNWKQSE